MNMLLNHLSTRAYKVSNIFIMSNNGYNNIELRDEMNDLEGKIQVVFRAAANDLGLEPMKTIRLENNSQLGHFLRVTKKVRR